MNRSMSVFFCPTPAPLLRVRTGLSGLMNGRSGRRGISSTSLFSYSMEAPPTCFLICKLAIGANLYVCVFMCKVTQPETHCINLPRFCKCTVCWMSESKGSFLP